MNKEESLIIKGVAIVFMLFLHLFSRADTIHLYHDLIYIGNEPFSYILSRAMNPVAFFLIVGGYGLYKVFEKGDTNRWKRIFNLYIHYWIIITLFQTLRNYVIGQPMPLPFKYYIYNITGYWTTLNGEMWFLLPYAILSLSAPVIFNFLLRNRSISVLVVGFAIHLFTSYSISRYGQRFLFYNYWAYNPLLVLHLSFYFILGAVAAKDNLFGKLKASLKFQQTKIIYIFTGACIIGLISLECVFKYNYLYPFLLICCLLILPLPGNVKFLLSLLGRHSMNIWMIHTWLCYYLFSDFIYYFKYPPIIFIVLLLCSYAISVIVNSIATGIFKIVYNSSGKFRFMPRTFYKGINKDIEPIVETEKN